MLYAPTSEESRTAEEMAVASGDVTLAELMERAGAALARKAAEVAPTGTIVVVAGNGNNGGDGWVAAGILRRTGRDVSVLSISSPGEGPEPAASASKRAADEGVGWKRVGGDPRRLADLSKASLIVDALLGTGFKPPAREPYATVLEALSVATAPVVSADVPSGVDATTGAADPRAVTASVTVTFSAPKMGILLYPGAERAGDIVVADIGLPPGSLGASARVAVTSREEWARALPRPRKLDHKNSRGRVLVVAGSPGMSGSAALCASGAMRMGAGYVRLACPFSVADTLAIKLTPVVVHALPSTRRGTLSSDAVRSVLSLADRCDSVVLGPGLTTAPATVKAVKRIVRGLKVPLVIDADGLNAITGNPARLLQARAAPTVLTPHPGELARLLGTTPSDVQDDRVGSSSALASDAVAVLLKGARTIVSGEGKHRLNLTGNPGMATAGSGDLLAGMIGTLLAQGLSAPDAAGLAAYLHGRAGDLAARELTEICMDAEDILRHVPGAVAELLTV